MSATRTSFTSAHKPFSIGSMPRIQGKHHHYRFCFKNVRDDRLARGYTLAPEPLIQAITKIQSQSTSNPTRLRNTPAGSYDGSMDTVPPMLAEYGKRRKRIVEGLRAIPVSRANGRAVRSTHFPIFPHIGEGKNAFAKSCTELSKLLLDKAHVALVPGEAFGAPGFLRLSYATSIERIEEGLRRLDKFFSRAEAAS